MSNPTNTEETTIEQQAPMISWAESRPYWEKYIWKKCLQNNTITEDELEIAYKYLKMDLGLVPNEDLEEIDFSGLIPPDDEALPKVNLKGIQDITNVNAIPDGQSIAFDNQLTLGWGMNGSGKSGYGRIMANACYSRGERIIYPNLRDENASSDPASANFIIENEDVSTSTITFTDGATDDVTLKRFAVFDSKCVNIQLNNTNTIQFVPGQLSVFDLVNTNIQVIEEKLNAELAIRKKINPVQESFGETVSPVSEYLLNLNNTVTDENITAFCTFPEDGDEQIRLLNEKQVALIKLDVPKKKKDLAEEQQTLTSYKQELTSLVENFGKDRIDTINNLIKDVIDKKALVQKLGVQTFDDGIFKSVGSDKWKALLITAKELYDAEQVLNEGKEIEHCLLCHQQLTDKEKTLFENYWLFLNDTAATELEAASNKLNEWKEYIQQVRLVLPKTDNEQPAIKLLLSSAPEFVSQLQTDVVKIGETLLAWETQIQELKSVNNIGAPEIILTAIDNLIAAKFKEAEALKDPNEEIEKIKKQIVELEHRKISNRLYANIKEYVEWLRWFDKANKVRFPKGTYTGQRTIFFNQIVTEEYTRIFNEESKKLNSEFGLTIESSGSSGETYVKLKFDFSARTKPTDVLSEGEQKVCALADFLSEIRLNKNNSGIIFDDPVTSLDHERKESIAKRLVEESKHRQIIILTHDIVFMSLLVKYATDLKVNFNAHWIKKLNGIPGLVEHNSSPKLSNFASLKEDSKNAMLGYGTKGEKEKEMALGVAFDYLRSATEAMIREFLFAGTIGRYDDHVKVTNLEEVTFDKNIALKIVALHGKISEEGLMHDRSDEMREKLPTDETYNIIFNEFEVLEKELREALKTARKERQDRKAEIKKNDTGW